MQVLFVIQKIFIFCCKCACNLPLFLLYLHLPVCQLINKMSEHFNINACHFEEKYLMFDGFFKNVCLCLTRSEWVVQNLGSGVQSFKFCHLCLSLLNKLWMGMTSGQTYNRCSQSSLNISKYIIKHISQNYTLPLR